MGILLADYLSALRDGIVSASDPSVANLLRRSLARYVEFVERELVDVATGVVFNDAGRDASQERLYNAPWVATFYLALHRLDGDAAHALVAYRVIRAFYAAGGAAFYPLELPVLELCDALHQAGFDAERDEASALFHHHARTLAATGRNYPPSEVNYEQSIVAPAADILLQTFILTSDPALLVAGEEQLTILDQFHGVQPDHHLHDVAVRHWDGYWFGKRQTYGDTFPHYWSALTGNVLALHARITGRRRHRPPRGEHHPRGAAADLRRRARIMRVRLPAQRQRRASRLRRPLRERPGLGTGVRAALTARPHRGRGIRLRSVLVLDHEVGAADRSGELRRCRANLNFESSSGTSMPSESLNPTARLPPSSIVYITLIDRPLS